MLKPHVTTKRVFGAVMAAGLAASAIVSLATNASAASVPAITLSPASGATVGGDTINVKGKGLADANGDSLVKAAYFSTTACADGAPSGTNLTLAALSVVSATKAVLVIPGSQLWTAGKAFICLFDGTTSSASVLGSGKYEVGLKPTITQVNGVNDATSIHLSASTFGGTPFNVTGTNFTKKTLVYVGTNKAATKFVSATKVTATVPAGIASTSTALKVTSEYGSATASADVVYLGSAKVSPTAGAPSTSNGIQLTGTGFSSLSFGTGSGKSVIAFLAAPVALTVGTTTQPTTNVCTGIVVESDTVLTCKTPSLTDGAYSVQILTEGASSKVGVINTVTSRSATYTAAAF